MSTFLLFDIDGVIRDVGGSYRRALADTVEHFTAGAYRPSVADIDQLKGEGQWNNDWEASQELIYRYFEAQGQPRDRHPLDYADIVAFFQTRYRGVDPSDPDHWTGYICQEPLLLSADYFEQLSAAGVPWGFVSGATRGSATYILERRLGLRSPILIAMEDAPGKPDPTGLFAAIHQLATCHQVTPTTVIYVGDTVADMYTVERARSHRFSIADSSIANSSIADSSIANSSIADSSIADSEAEAAIASTVALVQRWLGVGILPPHVQTQAQAQAQAQAQIQTAASPPIQTGLDYAANYASKLQQAGAAIVLNNVMELDVQQVQRLLV